MYAQIFIEKIFERKIVTTIPKIKIITDLASLNIFLILLKFHLILKSNLQLIS